MEIHHARTIGGSPPASICALAQAVGCGHSSRGALRRLCGDRGRGVRHAIGSSVLGLTLINSAAWRTEVDVRSAPGATRLLRGSGTTRTHASQQNASRIRSLVRNKLRVHSGNPAFRRPSITSFAFDCPPRAIHAEIVKPGSTSSRRAAASRASASRPRWAKADARQR